MTPPQTHSSHSPAIKLLLLLPLLFLTVLCSRRQPWPDETCVSCPATDPYAIAAYTKYFEEIQSGVIRSKIVQAIRDRRNCATLFSLTEKNVPLFYGGPSPLLEVLREEYPRPFTVVDSKTDIQLCW